MLSHPARRSAPMARFHREAIARGALLVRALEASSPNVTCLTWCSRFSIASARERVPPDQQRSPGAPSES